MSERQFPLAHVRADGPLARVRANGPLVHVRANAPLARFRADQSGAGSTDWIVVSAGVVALCLAVLAVTGGGTRALSGQMSGEIAGRPLPAAP